MLLIACLAFPIIGLHAPVTSGFVRFQGIGEHGPASLVMPNIGSAAPPPWVKTGLRLTYRVETATIAGTGMDWKPDENGAWETPDHKRWTPGERRPGAAGGFMQFDMTAVGSQSTAILASFYLVPSAGAPAQLTFQYPVVGLPGNTGGLWVHWDQLAKVQQRNTPKLKVLRMPYRIGNESRPAVWIQASTSSGYQVYVYDEASGILLHDASAVVGTPSPVMGKGEVSNTPSTILSDGTLVAPQRVLSLPWVGQSARAWANGASTMRYRGTTSVPTSGGRPVILQQDLVANPRARGDGWVVYDMLLTTRNTMGMPPTSTPSVTVSGLGQFGSAWLPPSSLASLRKGQQLDKDPITGVTVAVSDVRSGQVILTATSAAQTTRWGYDLTSGLLNLIDKQDHNIYAPISTHMTLVQK